MKLSKELELWHCDRPDEWKMDEFRRNAEKLEAERDAFLAELQKANAIILDLQRNPPKFTEQHLAEIRAEAVLQFAHWAFDTCPNIDCMFDDKDDYIAKIRQGGAA